MVIAIKLEEVASLFSEGIEPAPATLSQRRLRRKALLHESIVQRFRRVGASLAYAAARARAPELACGLDLLTRACPRSGDLPDPDQPLAFPRGFCALATDLSPPALLEAYSRGLSLFGPVGPIGWWSPSFRTIATPGEVGNCAAAHSELVRSGLEATMDTAFDEILAACARPHRRGGRLGFGPKLMRAYADLHEAGLAHSLELRRPGEAPVAGVFGLSVGRVFVMEGCYGPDHLVAAAVALLDRHLTAWGYAVHEARLGLAPGAGAPRWARRLGFRPISRRAYLERLRTSVSAGRPARWTFDPQLCEALAVARLQLRSSVAM